MKQTNKGITLIALIITIVVMLILVGVVVSITVNSNIIGKAKGATGEWQTKEGEEANIQGATIGGKQYNSLQEYATVYKKDPEKYVENYGDFITYSKDINNDNDITNDWKVFYDDGEYLFLIASEYVTYDLIPDCLKYENGGFVDSCRAKHEYYGMCNACAIRESD